MADWPDYATLPVPERIVFATMACLERAGMEALTVRSIAREAGVNVAAVNYYFGSKDELLTEVRRRQLATGFTEPLAELDAYLADEASTPRAALQRFLAQFISDMVQYPRTVEAHLHDALTRQDYSGEALRALNEFLDAFHGRTRAWLPAGDAAATRLSVAQLWSSIFFVGLLPRAAEPFLGGDFLSSTGVEAYAARLVEHYFPRA